MPQLDTVTYISQFFWLCFFFLGFYFSLVQFILPKMARILKYRQEKIANIQNQTSSYISETQSQEEKRWASYVACLNIQKKLAEAPVFKSKEIQEEVWETQLAFKSQKRLNDAFAYDFNGFNEHMVSQNSSLAYLFLVKKESPLLAPTLNNCYFLDAACSTQ